VESRREKELRRKYLIPAGLLHFRMIYPYIKLKRKIALYILTFKVFCIILLPDVILTFKIFDYPKF